MDFDDIDSELDDDFRRYRGQGYDADFSADTYEAYMRLASERDKSQGKVERIIAYIEKGEDLKAKIADRLSHYELLESFGESNPVDKLRSLSFKVDRALDAAREDLFVQQDRLQRAESAMREYEAKPFFSRMFS